MQRTLGRLTLGGLLAIGAGCRAPEPAPYVVHVSTIVVPAPARVENDEAAVDNSGPTLAVLDDFDVVFAQGSVAAPLTGARQETAAFLRLADEAYQGKNYEFALECAQRVRTLNPDCKEAAGLETLALDVQRTAQPNGEWNASVERLRNCRNISDQEFRDVLLRLHQTESDRFAVRATQYLKPTKGDTARATQQVLRIHPVVDLAPSGFAAEDLVELMECTIEPDTWGSSGNSVNAHSHNLVIFAPERVQRQVGDLLDDLRQAHK